MDITLIANLVLVGLIVIVVIASLIGLWKGIWKTSFKLIFRSVLFLIMVFCAQPIANAICNINFHSSFGLNLEIAGVAVTTIDNTVAQALVNTGKIAPVSGMTLYETCFALGHSLASYAIFFVLMILTLLIGSLLSTIFYHAIFKHLVSKKLRKKKKIRWAGAICGLLDGGLCVVMFISPLSSMTNLLISNTAVIDKTHDSKILDDKTYELIMSGLTGYKDSALFSTLNFLGPVSDGIMNQVVEVQINGIKMGFISELDGLLQIISPLLDGIEYNGSSFVIDNVKLLSVESVHSVLTLLSSSRLVISLIPGLISMGTALAEKDENLAEIINNMDFSDIDWSEDLKAVDRFYAKLYATGLVDSLLNNDLNFDASKMSEYKEAIKSVMEIDAIKNNLSAAMVYTCSMLNRQLGLKIFSTDINAYKDLDWDHEIGCLLEVITGLTNAFDIKNFKDFNFDEQFGSVLADSDKLSLLMKAIVGNPVGDTTSEPSGILDLQLLETIDVKALALTMLDKLDQLQGFIDKKEISSLLTGVDADFLKNEFSSILNAAPLLYNNSNLDLQNIDLSDEKQLAEIKKIIDRIGDSKILLAVLPSILKGSLSDMSDQMLFGLSIDDLNFYFDNGLEFKTEMNRLIDLIPTALSLSSSLESTQDKTTEEIIKALNLVDLENVLVGLFSSKIINPDHRIDGELTVEKNHNFVTIISGILSQQSMKDVGFVLPDNLDSILWLPQGEEKGEISHLIAAMRVLQEEASFFLNGTVSIDSLSGSMISRILEALGNSAVLSPSLGSILNQTVAPTLNQIGVSIDFDVVRDWKNEGNKLATIVDCLKGLTADGNLSNIDWLATDVKRVNAILTAFSSTDIMAVRQDDSGRYVDHFGSLLSSVFTSDAFNDVLGKGIEPSLFQVADPVTGEFNRGWSWSETVENCSFDLTVNGITESKTFQITKIGEIANLCNVLDSISKVGVDNITNGSADANSLETILNAVIETKTLGSVLPDLLSSALANIAPITFDSDNTINLSELNVDVFNTLSASEKKSEIHRLIQVYDEFKSGDLNQIFQDISKLTEEQLMSLQNLLDTMAAMKTFNTAKIGSRLSLYENIISCLLNYINLDQMITNNVGDKTKAKQQMISIITSIDQWETIGDTQGENARLINLVRQIGGIALDNISNSASLSPDQIESIMKAINPSALLHQAIPTFFEQAFDAFHLDNLLEIDGKTYYPIKYRVHLTNSMEDQAYWNHEIEGLVTLCRSLWSPSKNGYLDASSLGFGNGTISLYDILSPMDKLYLLQDSKEYIVYSMIANTSNSSLSPSGTPLTSLIRPIESDGELAEAVRIRKLFFPYGHTDEDLKTQCSILDTFLLDMANNIDASFGGTGGTILDGKIAYDFILNTMLISQKSDGSIGFTRSYFASEIVASFLKKGFAAIDNTFDPNFFYEVDPLTNRDYLNLNIVEAKGVKGLLDLAGATTKDQVVAAIRLMGFKAATIDALPATDLETRLLQSIHLKHYRDASGQAKLNNSKIALRLFNKYADNVSLGGITLSTLFAQLGFDISDQNFVFENLADRIASLPLS